MRLMAELRTWNADSGLIKDHRSIQINDHGRIRDQWQVG